MQVLPYKDTGLEQARLEEAQAVFKITWSTNTTPASQTIASSIGSAVFPYVANGTDPSSTSVDTGAAFGNLNNTTAPSTCGIIVKTSVTGVTPANGIANDIIGISYEPVTFAAGSSAGTAVTFALKGASSSGVTASGNVAFVASVTGLDADAQTTTVSFWLTVKYRQKIGVQ